MILETLPYGMLESNCYILGQNGEGIVIDAGVESEYIKKAIEKNGLTIKYILLTHGHYDHICCVDDIRKVTGAKVAIHEDEARALKDPSCNLSALFGENAVYEDADILLKDGDVLQVGGLRLEIIKTPGHSLGSICIKTGNCVFTGDTLFKMSIGRTDLTGGNYHDIIRSIRERLLVLDDGTKLYPGHGGSTTVGSEREENPCI